jgi:hypothetical protein
MAKMVDRLVDWLWHHWGSKPVKDAVHNTRGAFGAPRRFPKYNAGR